MTLLPNGTYFSDYIEFKYNLGNNNVFHVYYSPTNGQSAVNIPINTPNPAIANGSYYTLIDNIITIYTKHFSSFFIDYNPLCVGPDTLILMADEIYKPICELERGDLIKCYHGNMRISDILYTDIKEAKLQNYIIPENEIINGNKLIKPLLITGWHPIMYNNLRVPIGFIQNKNYKYNKTINDTKLYDLQFDIPTYYNANGIWIQSRSPYNVYTPLDKEKYWDDINYKEERTLDDPEYYKEPLVLYTIHKNDKRILLKK
jgi:hypothetical protein